MTARIEPLEPPYQDDVEEMLASMMPPGVEPLRLFKTLAHNPRVLGKIRAGNLLDRGAIDRVDREMVILRTTARCGSEYEWGVHVPIFARRFGISEEKIAGSSSWDASDSRWSERESVLVGLVDALHDNAQVGDALWEQLRRHFDTDEIVELLVLTGFYHTISFVTNALQIELEPAAERFPSGAAAAPGGEWAAAT